MYANLCGVEIKYRISVDEIPAEGIIPADPVNLPLGIGGVFQGLGKDLLAVQAQILPGKIQGNHQQIGAAGGLGQVDDLPHIVMIHTPATQQKGALGQGTAGFVYADCRHIRTGSHSVEGQILPEVKMGAVGLVHQHLHAVLVGQLHNLPQIGADAVIGGIVDQDRLGVRMLGNGTAHILQCHAQGNSQPLVDARVDINRHSAAYHQCIDGTAVHVPGHNDLLPRLAHGHDHSLDGGGSAVDDEEGMLCTEGLRCQLFSVLYHRNRVTEIVQRLHGIHVHRHTVCTQKITQLLVAPSALVTGHIQPHHIILLMPAQRLINRGIRLRICHRLPLPRRHQ